MQTQMWISHTSADIKLIETVCSLLTAISVIHEYIYRDHILTNV